MVMTKTSASVTAVMICLKGHTLAIICSGFFRVSLDSLVFVSILDFSFVFFRLV